MNAPPAIKKILVTGGTGFIGSHTAVELVKAGYCPVIADDLSNSSESVVSKISEICGKEVKFYRIDLKDEAGLDEIFKAEKFYAVIHFAGYKAVSESVKVPLRYYENNLLSSINLVKCMRRHKINKIIFSSSATVYGRPTSLPLTEDMPLGECSNPYGRTKKMIEKILCDVSSANPEFSVSLLRYFNPLGAHPSGLIGENPSGVANNLMPYIAQVAVGKRDKLYVFGDDYPTSDGTGVRDYVHVLDLARGHVLSLKRLEKRNGSEIFNLGTGKGTSVLELIHCFEKVNNIKIPYEISSRREGDIAEYYADISKAERLLSFKPLFSLEDMCRDSYRYQVNNL